jgi:26S proteasome non-ATPase regulatory subunit 10
MLSRQPAASTRVRDKHGQYPIHRAAAVGSTPMILLLLKNKSPIDATDNAGYTALHHAIAEGHGNRPSTRVKNLVIVLKFPPFTGDTAIALLREGAVATKRDGDGFLAIDLAPDMEVCVEPCLVPAISKVRS